MQNPIWLVLAIALSLFVGPAMAACEYTLNPATVPAGTLITVKAPADWHGRGLDYAWDVVTSAGVAVTLYGEAGDGTDTYSFYAPDTGDYKITLTVNDKTYKASCLNSRCMAFSTSTSFTCPITGNTFCEADYATALPTSFTYTGALVPGRALQWVVDTTIVKEGLANVAGMDVFTPTWTGAGGIFDVTPEVGNTPGGINTGETHTVTLNVYKTPFTLVGGHYTATLENTCTGTFTSIGKPLAVITQTVP